MALARKEVTVIRHLILDWDSKFFGFKVARIIPERLEVSELRGILAELGQEGVSLAYWGSDPSDGASQQAACELGGFLADRKVTYVIDAEEIRARTVAPSVAIEVYPAQLATPDLEELAVQAGIFSRFKVDPRMPVGSFEELYRLWIRNSVNGSIAKQVLVVRNGEHIVGMVTLGEKGGRADIGLIAVDATMRGMGLGISLISAAQEWTLKMGLPAAQVVTQGANREACRIYEKCGYHIEKTENIYHFWMQS